MGVHVEMLSGDSTALDVRAASTVGELQERIEGTLGIPQFYQCLLLGDRALGNCSATLSDAGVVDGSTLKVLHCRPPLLAEESAFKSVLVQGHSRFRVPCHMEFVKLVSSGPRMAAAFRDSISGRKAHVTRVADAFEELFQGWRCLHELRLLRSLKHENILRILDVYPPGDVDFRDIYFATEAMPTNLGRVICSKQTLTDDHCQCFTWQTLRALCFLHSAGVVHADLTPRCILLDRNCNLKLTGFHKAHPPWSVERDEDDHDEYLVQRWYKAPESVIPCNSVPSPAADVWSVGCILCECLGRRPAFRGKDCLDQIKKILQVLGAPEEKDLAWLPPDGTARRYLKKLPHTPKADWASLYPWAAPAAFRFLDTVLRFSPAQRSSAQDALRHEYLAQFFREDDMPRDVCQTPFDWSSNPILTDSFFRAVSKPALQNHVYCECAAFHPEILDRDRDKLEARGISRLLPAVGVPWQDA